MKRNLFRVQYRLTVLYRGDTHPRHSYGTSRRTLRRMAVSTQDISLYWSLYKSVPLFLPEREVDSFVHD